MIIPLVRLTFQGKSRYIDPMKVVKIYWCNNGVESEPRWITRIVLENNDWIEVDETVDSAAQIINSARYLVGHPYRGEQR